MNDKVSAKVIPDHALSVLSQKEVERLVSLRNSEHGDTFRQCALAVLNTGSDSDDTSEILEAYADFAIEVVQQERGVKVQVENAPASAFVEGKMILGIQEHVFSVLRDVLYMNQEVHDLQDINFDTSEGITNGVFHILRNSGLLKPTNQTNIVVCWGGHSIGPEEYDYSKEVGYQMGLRGLDICTGCGPGAMKGPMKGATFGHAKQRISGRYIGISEPG